MKRRLVIFIILGILLGIGTVFANESSPLETLTLEAALDRIEYHSDYQTWLNSVTSVENTIQSIKDKHTIGLDLSGNLLSYTYNLDNETTNIATGAGLSLSKSSLSGTTLTGSLSPTYSISNSGLNTKWTFGLKQAIWPSPSLGNDQITLAIAEQTNDVLAEQQAYMVVNAQLKIEDLYRTAQFAVARVSFAEISLANARLALHVISQKAALGEASEADLIAGQLGVLRAERDLESSTLSAQTAKDNLFAALELEGNYSLTVLDIQGVSGDTVDLNLDQLLANLEHHPLVLHYGYELEKALLDLEAAHELRKPEANLSISFGESNQGNQFQAALSIGYPLLDRNQRVSTLEEHQKSLDDVKQSQANAVENVKRLIEEAARELIKLERDKEIAQLTLRQAELEWTAAKQRHEAGIIDDSALSSAELTLGQAQLSYFESDFRYDLAKRRLSCGIVGDLPGTGGLSR